MKGDIAIICITLYAFIAFSCNAPQTKETPTNQPKFVSGSEWMVQDSSRINNIEMLRDSLDRALVSGNYTRVSIAPDFKGGGDDLTYFVRNDSIYGISYSYYTDDLVIRLMYMLQNNNLVWAQTRVWKRTGDQPDATQVQFYLDSDSLFYVTEKYVELGEGEPPAIIGSMAPRPSNRSKDSLMLELKSNWDPIYKLVLDDINNQ